MHGTTLPRFPTLPLLHPCCSTGGGFETGDIRWFADGQVRSCARVSDSEPGLAGWTFHHSHTHAFLTLSIPDRYPTPSRCYRLSAPLQLNVSYNCLDRHVKAGRGDTVAILFEGDEPGDVRKYTYAQVRARHFSFGSLKAACRAGLAAVFQAYHAQRPLPRPTLAHGNSTLAPPDLRIPTTSQVLAEVCRVANVLTFHGVKKGDTGE